jgi:hypothetical protein
MHRMITMLWVMAACHKDAPPPPARAPEVTRVAAPAVAPVAPPVVAPVARPANELVPRTFTATGENAGLTATVWIDPARIAGMSLDDPCCGLWYDGGQYAATNATCAPNGKDACADPLWTVTPGLAEDPVCGTRRRCMPLPEVRVIVLDGGAVIARDLTEEALPRGSDDAKLAYGRVRVTREGAFVAVGEGKRQQLVAVDLGVRYTIYVRGGSIERVTRDDIAAPHKG